MCYWTFVRNVLSLIYTVDRFYYYFVQKDRVGEPNP